MAQCERLNGCLFFKKLQCLPKTAHQLLETYCLGDHNRCARFWVASAKLPPPEDLFPNEQDRAVRIISDAGKHLRTAPEKMSSKKN
ncbi:MAG TPA: hypothetical protein VMD76_14660 [Candidatus Sulfotelmatobacter sp.]|nr:hypothetical protein [Candidatus Sulfotelmatobacter sp.]